MKAAAEPRDHRFEFEEYEPELDLSLADLEPYLDRSVAAAIEALAGPLAGRRWVDLNSTFVGGGVAEMLRSIVPLARSLGIDSRWYRIDGDGDFYRVTKTFHNMLQGVACPLTLEDLFETYLDTISWNARKVPIRADVIMVHDPQPVGLVATDALEGSLLWRCHIDTTRPNPVVRRFILPYVNTCQGAVFTTAGSVFQGLRIPAYLMSPAIDPRSQKNRHRPLEEVDEILAPRFAEHGIDPQRPVVAAVSRYDIHKNQAMVLEAFLHWRQRNRPEPPPYLIFLGNSADDDPEGAAVLRGLKADAAGDPDVKHWLNVPDNDRVVGSLMRKARMLVHVPTREGFGLVVTEALWQDTPVIGSRVGGVPSQVIDGTTGFLVDPTDVDAIAGRMETLFSDRELAGRLGEQGRRHVRKNFLLPEMMRRYLHLLAYHCGNRTVPPDFSLGAGCDVRYP